MMNMLDKEEALKRLRAMSPEVVARILEQALDDSNIECTEETGGIIFNGFTNVEDSDKEVEFIQNIEVECAFESGLNSIVYNTLEDESLKIQFVSHAIYGREQQQYDYMKRIEYSTEFLHNKSLKCA